METPRSKSNPNQQRPIRVVGRIRPVVGSEVMRDSHGDSSSSTNCSQVSMSRTEGEFASIAFGDLANGRKDSFKLDWCYGQDDSTMEVFSKEVKPILQGILKGCNGCVIAYGARGSGKTQLIQGSEENPGLAQLTISEFIPVVEELGGSVAISCYEVCQDRVFDLLEPKQQEVLVMEDASRRIQLKGLSQAPVKSVSDFKKSYFNVCNERKISQKVTTDVATRNHRGLIIHVSCVDMESNSSRLGKMNFVDLAGYEDTKSKSVAKPGLAEIVKANKSLYALLNVVCALNNSDTYVPYRQTKLTHLLQDFICRTSGAVMFTCLNLKPCQDTIHAVSLASRSCQAANKYRCDSSSKSNKNGPRFVPLSSPINRDIQALGASVKKLKISKLGSVERTGSETSSLTKKRPQPLNNSQKKPGTSVSRKIEKKVSEVSCANEERILSNSTNLISNFEKEIAGSWNPDNQSSMLEVNYSAADEQHILKVTEIDPSISEITVSCNPDSESSMLDVNASVTDEQNILKATEIDPSISEVEIFGRNEPCDVKDSINSGLEVEFQILRDPHVVSLDKEKTPTITQKLREISNSLKLASSRPISVSTPQDLCKRQVNLDSMEPKTPVCFRTAGYSRFEDIGTPQDILKAKSTGLKKSLVQECLAFLNSANKEELKELKGIGEKRSAYILKLREMTPDPFKDIDDLKDLGLSSKQINGMMSQLLDF